MDLDEILIEEQKYSYSKTEPKDKSLNFGLTRLQSVRQHVKIYQPV